MCGAVVLYCSRAVVDAVVVSLSAWEEEQESLKSGGRRRLPADDCDSVTGSAEHDENDHSESIFHWEQLTAHDCHAQPTPTERLPHHDGRAVREGAHRRGHRDAGYTARGAGSA